MLLYKCRKEKKLLDLTGITPLLILTIGTLVRFFVPIDIPNFTRVIEFDGIFTLLHSVLYTRWGNTPLNLMIFLYVIWGIGCVITSAKALRKHFRFYRRIRRFERTEDGSLVECAKSIAKELHTVVPHIVETDCVASPTATGLFYPTVLLPSLDISEADYRYVFLHELMHWRERDMHIKVVTKVFCCLFWWNPCCRYLERDLHDIVEFRCDQSLALRMSKAERDEYAYVLGKTIKTVSDEEKEDLPFCVAEFSDAKAEIDERVALMLKAARRKNKQKLASALVILGLILLLIFSYSFVIQSHYYAPQDEIVPNSHAYEFTSNTDETYLVAESDGNYSVYVNGEYIDTIGPDFAHIMLDDGFEIQNSE